MTDNKIIIGGAVLPSTPDTPTDARCRVDSYEDISKVENPYVGMKIYVRDSGKEYQVRKLADKEVGGITIPGGSVDPEGVADVEEEIVKVAAKEAAKEVQNDFSIATKSRYDAESETLHLL